MRAILMFVSLVFLLFCKFGIDFPWYIIVPAGLSWIFSFINTVYEVPSKIQTTCEVCNRLKYVAASYAFCLLSVLINACYLAWTVSEITH